MSGNGLALLAVFVLIVYLFATNRIYSVMSAIGPL